LVRPNYAVSGADVNGDNKLGAPEAVYALQSAASLRVPSGSFNLKSTAMTNGQRIPDKYTGTGVSPPLTWSNPPAGTGSYVLIMDDPDAVPIGGLVWNHWLVYDIPAGTATLAENAGASGGASLPAGAKHGTNSWDTNNLYYRGPDPPDKTGTHQYHFKLYALSAANITPDGGTTRDKIEAAMAGSILGQCELTVTFSKP
jgi:Raf kinase inhibitor-like YbhB/YbcL family protein